MREFKRGLDVGNNCLTRHPSSNLWTVAKILQNQNDAIILQVEDWPDVVKCGVWFSEIIPQDTFDIVGPVTKDKRTKTSNKIVPHDRRLGPENVSNSDGLLDGLTPEDFLKKYMEDMQVLLSKCKGECIDEELISAVGRTSQEYNKILRGDHNFQVYMTENINDNVEFKILTSKAFKTVENWKFSITTGKSVDIYHEQDKKWFHAKVKERKANTIDVHYNGWPAKFDETLDLVKTNGVIYPEHTFTKRRKKSTIAEGRKEKNNCKYIYVEVDADDAIEEDTYWNRFGRTISEHTSEIGSKTWISGSGWIDTDKIDESMSKTGRRVIKRSNENSSVDRRFCKKAKSLKHDIIKPREDNNDILCSICDQLEAVDHSDLILCDGPCLRSWHLGCMDCIDSSGFPDEWMCEDCERGQHKCSYCGDFGRDDIDLYKCMDKKCGIYYHYNCLTQLDAEYLILKEPSGVMEDIPCLYNDTKEQVSMKQLQFQARSFREGSRQYVKIEKMIHSLKKDEEMIEKAKYACKLVYKCPAHFCQTCYEFYGDLPKKTFKRKSEAMLQCIGKGCSKAFHFNCLPPGGRYGKDDLYMKCLCHAHPDMAMPSFKAGFQAVEEKTPGNALFWDQLTINLPSDDPRAKKLEDYGHFRLSTKIRRDVTFAAPQFKNLFSLDYDTLPGGMKSVPFHFPEVCCNCEVATVFKAERSNKGCEYGIEFDRHSSGQELCGSNCLNRTLFVECYDIPGKKSDQICNVSHICSGDCGNRQFQKRHYVKVKPFIEGNMGWGLKTVDSVKKGTLVIEYLGEVIDEEEMNARMHYQRTFTPRDHDFYIMELENGLYVDGKRKGNLSRFINHSCNPNCELVRWNVKGRIRIGIFALKDIDSGEPLSYDYQFDTKEANAFKCHCGASNCRGTMAPKERESKVAKSLSKEEKAKMITAGKQRDRYSKELRLFDEIKRSCVSKTLPGDQFFQVKDGPLRANVNIARYRKIFLPRNTNAGYKFLQRRDMLKHLRSYK